MKGRCWELGLLLLLAAAVPASCETTLCRLQDCPNYRTIRFYQELGCARVDDPSGCCPIRFDCSSLLSQDKTKCHYDGKTIEPGSEITSGIKRICTPACYCSSVEDGPWKGEATFACATPGCAGYPIPEGKEDVCYQTFSVDQCCGTGIKCSNDTKSPRNVTECAYNGKTFLEGQFIEGTDSECMRCVCQQGYDGTLREPWCRRHSCDYNLGWTTSQLRVCAPVFDENDECCAHDFNCPSDTDFVVRQTESTTANEGGQCSFGQHKLNVGDHLMSFSHIGDKCIKCTCDIPPFVTCKHSHECPVAKK